jgi:hypothetical protein
MSLFRILLVYDCVHPASLGGVEIVGAYAPDP